MKNLLCVIFALVTTTSVIAAPDPKSGENWETKFKARYHRWAAAIYERPGTLLLSDSRAYIDFPEYQEIVKLGHPALPAIAREIEADSDMALFLCHAILQITGWKTSDFKNDGGLQGLNRQLLARLRKEKLIPNKEK